IPRYRWGFAVWDEGVHQLPPRRVDQDNVGIRRNCSLCRSVEREPVAFCERRHCGEGTQNGDLSLDIAIEYFSKTACGTSKLTLELLMLKRRRSRQQHGRKPEYRQQRYCCKGDKMRAEGIALAQPPLGHHSMLQYRPTIKAGTRGGARGLHHIDWRQNV